MCRLKHKRYSKLIHITAHLSLGVRLRRVRILVVRSLPVGRSAGPHFTRAPWLPRLMLLRSVLTQIFANIMQRLTTVTKLVITVKYKFSSSDCIHNLLNGTVLIFSTVNRHLVVIVGETHSAGKVCSSQLNYFNIAINETRQHIVPHTDARTDIYLGFL